MSDIRKKITLAIAGIEKPTEEILTIIKLYEELNTELETKIAEITTQALTRPSYGNNRGKDKKKAPETLDEAFNWKMSWKKKPELHDRTLQDIFESKDDKWCIKWIAEMDDYRNKAQQEACKLIIEAHKADKPVEQTQTMNDSGKDSPFIQLPNDELQRLNEILTPEKRKTWCNRCEVKDLKFLSHQQFLIILEKEGYKAS